MPIPIPGLKGDSGVSLTTSFRAGLLYPLAVGYVLSRSIVLLLLCLSSKASLHGHTLRSCSLHEWRSPDTGKADLNRFDSDSKITSSRINDRFQLGGPADVRGFRLSGLGPHDGADAVGGDVYAAGYVISRFFVLRDLFLNPTK